jgi:hypothetical protein
VEGGKIVCFGTRESPHALLATMKCRGLDGSSIIIIIKRVYRLFHHQEVILGMTLIARVNATVQTRQCEHSNHRRGSNTVLGQYPINRS